MKLLVIAFFVVQIGVDLAHSVTAFPFVHFGMFSESFARPDSILVYRISVDGRLLERDHFPVYDWDMMQGLLTAAVKRDATGDYAFDKEKMRTGMHTMGMDSFYNRLRPNLDNHGDFVAWYKGYLGRLIGRPVGALQVDKSWWRWQDGKLALIGTQNWING
jgi:hypothetical protein